ncbi:MAG: anti-sigma regulatory factor [Clostridiales bacterium]|jgi:anti-sigma regulatory factor (Ser/Thr protein kinase)|nr:anti-sigma regulatory factor [Clostridiales bacterium]
MDDSVFSRVFPVQKGMFDTAGEASSKIKKILKKVGIPPDIVRDVAIAAYETELNLVIHSLGGELTLSVNPEIIELISQDVGPGINDVNMALKEGYSTAPDDVRDMGFGAGMGLPNVQRHCHEFQIASELGRGTTIRAKYFLKNN